MADDTADDLVTGQVEELARRLQEHKRTLAVAESLTGGQVTQLMARGPDASSWLRGGVVAYASEVKYALLGVRRGPVVSEDAALDMARGVARVLDADVGLAVTGVGGPDPQDGQPPGTVWMAVHLDGSTSARLYRFDGDPTAICDQSARTLVDWALACLG